MQQKQSPRNNSRDAKVKRATDKPLVTCCYGWKRTCALYNDRIDVDGTMYALDDLVQVRTMYRTVMNVPSVRLELRFRKEDVILRGIAAIEDAKSIVEYLEAYCADNSAMIPRLREKRKREDRSTTGRMETVARFHGEDTTHITSEMMQAQAEATTAPIEAPAWLQNLEQHVIYTREQLRTKAYRSIRKYGFNVQNAVQEAEADTLPSVAVPLRLLPQETAHYYTEATLSQRPPASSEQTSRAMDHGRLILTSKRAIYIGRTGQIVLDYARLTHVLRLHDAIVFSTDSGSRHYVFEMQCPLQCALHLDGILRQFQRHQSAVSVPQPPSYQSRLQHAHTTRTGQLRHAAHSRQAVHTRASKHVLELEDIETLPLSLLMQHAEVEEVW